MSTFSEELRAKVLTRIETIFNLTGELPSYELVLEKLELEDSSALQEWFREEINPRLVLRGISPIVNHVEGDEEYDPLFILACNSLLDVNDTRSKAAKLKELEPLIPSPSKRWTAWMEIPKYRTYFETILKRRFSEQVSLSADLALARNVETGDLQSIKYYNEMTARYRPVDQNTQNVGMILAIIMQILAKHVKPEIIEAVASELENSSIDLLFPSPVGELQSGHARI